MNHLSQIVGTLETIGIEPERILSRTTGRTWLGTDPEALIPLHDVLRVIEAGAHTVGNATFGLDVGKANSLAQFATFGKMISQSLTTYHALQNVCQFVHLHTTVSRFWLVGAGDKTWFCRGQLEGFKVGLQHMEQYTLTQMVRIIRLGAGPDWQPSEVWVCASDRPRLEETELLCRARIRYLQPFTAVAIPQSGLSRPIRRNSAPNTPDSAVLHKHLRSKTPATSFAGSLRQVIESHLHQGQLDIHSAAEICGLHERSLQRQLSKDRLTYRQVVDQARFQTATRLLLDPNVKVTDVAYDLGYSDVAHFSRAFRRLAGVSPREYRAS